MPDDPKNLTPAELELLAKAKAAQRDPVNLWPYQQTANPATILKLLADLDAARAQYASIRDHLGVSEFSSRPLERFIDDMKRTVAAVPKTADGVPIVPGMELWGIYTGHENDQFREGSGTVQRWVFEPHYCAWAKYSTREAALAAKGTVGT